MRTGDTIVFNTARILEAIEKAFRAAEKTDEPAGILGLVLSIFEDTLPEQYENYWNDIERAVGLMAIVALNLAKLKDYTALSIRRIHVRLDQMRKRILQHIGRAALGITCADSLLKSIPTPPQMKYCFS